MANPSSGDAGPETLESKADIIAEVVLRQYDKLPNKRKPHVRDNGWQEWVPLSGIVAEYGNGHLRCLALASGMKCLPASKLDQVRGNAIHDWHAEVLAIRAFNHFAVEECKRIIQGDDSDIFQRRLPEVQAANDTSEWQGQPFVLREGVVLYMYCSEAPCGDASMELTMAAQDDDAPWDTAVDAGTQTLLGRQYFSLLGIVRRKPSRADADTTLSKSCSDKLALRQCTSLLSSLTSMLISPKRVYLGGLVLPASQYSSIAFERCFGREGRMKKTMDREWEGGYSCHEILPLVTGLHFKYSKRAVGERAGGANKLATSNLAATWTCLGLEESLLGGVLQGKRGFDDQSASRLSRKSMWRLVLEISKTLQDSAGYIASELAVRDYGTMKNCPFLSPRRRVKHDVKEDALKGWVPNSPDSGFGPSSESTEKSL